jgi:hypothetical protein
MQAAAGGVDMGMLALAHELADAAGRITSQYFRTAHFSVDSKSDASPVTIADKQAETVMRSLIEQAYPAHGIFGEPRPRPSRRTWRGCSWHLHALQQHRQDPSIGAALEMRVAAGSSAPRGCCRGGAWAEAGVG